MPTHFFIFPFTDLRQRDHLFPCHLPSVQEVPDIVLLTQHESTLSITLQLIATEARPRVLRHHLLFRASPEFLHRLEEGLKDLFPRSCQHIIHVDSQVSTRQPLLLAFLHNPPQVGLSCRLHAIPLTILYPLKSSEGFISEVPPIRWALSESVQRASHPPLLSRSTQSHLTKDCWGLHQRSFLPPPRGLQESSCHVDAAQAPLG